MPVRRYRHVADMPPPQLARTAMHGLAAACELSELCAAIGRTSRAPRGVLRFKSIQDADAHRRQWEARPL